MAKDNVVSLPMTTTYTVEQALQAALAAGLTNVVIVGEFDNQELFVCSSRMKRADANWLMDRGKFHSLGNSIKE